MSAWNKSFSFQYESISTDFLDFTHTLYTVILQFKEYAKITFYCSY